MLLERPLRCLRAEQSCSAPCRHCTAWLKRMLCLSPLIFKTLVSPPLLQGFARSGASTFVKQVACLDFLLFACGLMCAESLPLVMDLAAPELMPLLKGMACADPVLPALGSASLDSFLPLRSVFHPGFVMLAHDSVQPGSFLFLQAHAAGTKLSLLDVSHLGLSLPARCMA